MSTNSKKKTYTIYVKRDVLFEAHVKANSLKEAFEKSESMSIGQLWESPGDIIDDSHELTAVFK